MAPPTNPPSRSRDAQSGVHVFRREPAVSAVAPRANEALDDLEQRAMRRMHRFVVHSRPDVLATA
eukprot:3993495-Lingulodinium_polyedra.AAC.1